MFVRRQLWLCDLEKIMRLTLKDHLMRCLMALKQTKQREKWIPEWPGQVQHPPSPVSVCVVMLLL